MDTASRLRLMATRFIGRNRRSFPIRWMGQAAYLFWRAYENRSFELESNGEAWCLRRIATLRPRCFFDVGANVGDWIDFGRRVAPTATIHAFEIAPLTFGKLEKRFANCSNLVLNPFGLSDRNGEIDIFFPDDADYRTTAYLDNLTPAFEPPGKNTMVRRLKARVCCGDEYAKAKGIESIDFLKIDVEGMEHSVLSGFTEMLTQKQIRAVQFEYNTTNIASGFLLKHAYEFFRNLGYCIGKLYPTYVEFRDYHYRHEDFGGPNMLAIHAGDHELRQLLGDA